MADSNPPHRFTTIVEIAEYAKKMTDIDEMVKFVEAENSHLNSPYAPEDLNKLISAISKNTRENQIEFDSDRCLEEMKKVIPTGNESDRVKQALNFVETQMLSKNGDLTDFELFIEDKVFYYFDIGPGRYSKFGQIFRRGYREMLKEKRKKKSKLEIANENDNWETIETGEKSVFTVTKEDIHQRLEVSDIGTLDRLEAGGYHIEALRLLYFQNDSFGDSRYNTANYRAEDTGLFFYSPERVYKSMGDKDGTDKIFYGWEFTKLQISPTPVTVMDSALNIDSIHGEILYTLQVKNEYGKTDNFTVNKKTLFTKRGILELNDRNFCVTDNAKIIGHIQEYFMKLFYDNTLLIPRTIAAESTGWKKEGKYFVLGNRAYTDKKVIPIHMLDPWLERSYTPKGNIEDYVNGNREIIEIFPVARFMIYAGCAAVILTLLGLNSIVIFLKGDSTTGKTKLCTLAVSPFTYMTKTADSTKVYQELDAAQNNGLPLFYDEATGNEERLNSILYMLANGSGKGRGMKNAEGVSHGKTWKSVIFYNGENPVLTEFDNVGKYVRVIEIINPVQKSEKNKELMDRIEKTCSLNHGLLADLFLKEVFSRKSEIPKMYEESLRKFEKSNDAGERVKKHFAAFTVAGEILEDIFSQIGIKKVDAFEIVNGFFREVVLGRPIVDEYKRALELVWNWVISNEGNRVINTTSPVRSKENPDYNPNEIWAWITEAQTKELTVSFSERICFIPAKLKQILKENGFNADKIIEKWAEHKIIDSVQRVDKNGRIYGKRITELNKSIDDRPYKAIKIIADNAMEELGLVEHPELKMPEKTPLQKLKDAIIEHDKMRLQYGIKDTKETFIDSFLEQRKGNFSRDDVEFVMDKMCDTGKLHAMSKS